MSRRKSIPKDTPGLSYARKVSTGKIAANRWLKATARNFLADLKASYAGTGDVFFDSEAVDRVLKFCSFCCHIKGDLAKKTYRNPDTGRPEAHPFQPLPWQVWVIAYVFGFRYRETGRRRCRYVYLEVGRKNGKTFFSAVIALYMLLADGEPGAEVYAIANSLRQSRRGVFEVAKAILSRSRYLPSGRAELLKESIEVKFSDSFFETWSSATKDKDGAFAHFWVADEAHEYADAQAANWRNLEESMAARSNPISWTITTSGWNRDTFCGDLRASCEELLDPANAYKDPSKLAFLYGLDPEDDPRDERTWIKANPNYGQLGGPTKEYLTSMILGADRDAKKWPDVLRKHFSVWAPPTDECPFDSEDLVAAVDRAVDVGALAGRRCFGAMDLGSPFGSNAFTLFFPPDPDGEKPAALLGWTWLPKAAAPSDRSSHFDQHRAWVEAGSIVETDGEGRDSMAIRDHILATSKLYKVQQLAWDARKMSGVEADFEREGIALKVKNFTGWGQNAGFVEFRRLITDGEVSFVGNPLFSHQATQTRRVVQASTDLERPSPMKRGVSIELINCAVACVGLWLENPIEEVYNAPIYRPSGVESRGVDRFY